MAASSLPEVFCQMAEYFPHKAQPDLSILRIAEEASGSRFLLPQTVQTCLNINMGTAEAGTSLIDHEATTKGIFVRHCTGPSHPEARDWLLKAVLHLLLNLGSPFFVCLSWLEHWFPSASGSAGWPISAEPQMAIEGQTTKHWTPVILLWSGYATAWNVVFHKLMLILSSHYDGWGK